MFYEFNMFYGLLPIYILSTFVDLFIQALLLTSIFHEGLSSMSVVHNPMCVSTLALAAGGSRGHYKPPLWGSWAKYLEALTISAIPGFQIALPSTIQ